MSMSIRRPKQAKDLPAAKLPREIKVLVAAAFMIAIGFGIVAPVLPQFAQSFDVSVTAAAVVVSAFAFTRLTFAPLSGWLVERMGERRTYILGILIVAASSAACAFAQDYWQLLIYRGLGGIGSTMFTVAAMGLLIRLAPPQARGRVSSLYSGSFLLGNIAGPAVGGLLAGFGMALPFLVYAAALVLVAVLVATQLPAASAQANRKGLVTAVKKEVLPLRVALGLPTYRAVLGSAFANGWSAFGLRMALVPLFATAALGAGPEVAGISLAVFAIGTGVALTFSGKLADTWGRKPMILSGLAVNGLAMGALGFTGNEFWFFLISAIAGLGSGLMGPAQQATVADVIGNERSGGKVLATFQMSSDLGAIIGPIAAGLLVDAFSYGPAFLMATAVALLAMVLWLPAKDTHPA
ncbi:MFS transporter [Arthrobacter psychrochitiniphilus]|uniref:MFS transporter n=2 Tax=Arthrobacter TaxID=1663 RepID=A0A2V3DNC7_9MICC|nr:MFS transporter [Arthrobacter psychrochitiniphilus]NYG17999.1 MFS family permease [Arthrobacter psychrochitiniphilus]PXA64267.1 MFS transporter [Arthrobacter psychrochitiniphilus]